MSQLETQVKQLKDILDQAKKIVFFGGAGVSTESGIPDFRSTDGLYNQQYAYPPETILSHSFFRQNAQEFYRFYKDKILQPALSAKPNKAHLALARLEQAGKLTGVVTQNIDGLHQAAGSKQVFELHGSILRNYCVRCGKSYDATYMYQQDGVPKCSCGGVIKPDVVLYEEALDDAVVEGAIQAIEEADVLIVGGTSLVVYPAAGLIRYFHGKYRILINKSATSMDEMANLIIQAPIGEVLGSI